MKFRCWRKDHSRGEPCVCCDHCAGVPISYLHTMSWLLFSIVKLVELVCTLSVIVKLREPSFPALVARVGSCQVANLSTWGSSTRQPCRHPRTIWMRTSCNRRWAIIGNGKRESLHSRGDKVVKVSVTLPSHCPAVRGVPHRHISKSALFQIRVFS